VLQLRTADDFRARGSGVIQLPPGLTMAERTPTYVNPEVARVDQVAAQPSAVAAGHPTVDRYLDVRVRRRAQLAPLAFLVLICIALIIYFSIK
jgi:hypothetical protein